MEKFKDALQSLGINIIHFNLDALYDYCGDDLMLFFNAPSDENTVKLSIKLSVKYATNPVIISLIRIKNNETQPYLVVYKNNKYKDLSCSVLDLNEHNIFVSIVEYFLGEDIIYLNMDAIYDECEDFFTCLIKMLRNGLFVIGFHEHVCDERYYHVDVHDPGQNFSVPNTLSTMIPIYIGVWCYIMMAKMKSINLIITLLNKTRYLDVLTGDVYEQLAVGVPCPEYFDHFAVDREFF